MSEPAVNREEVYVAADRLFAEGTTPTAGAIKESIGKGNYSTISRFLHAWQKDPHRRTKNQLPPPPEVISQGLNHVWSQAWLLGQQEVLQERQNSEYLHLGIENEKQEMLSEISRLEALLEAQKLGIDGFGQERAAFEKQLDNLRRDLALARVDSVPAKERQEREKVALQVELDQSKREIASQQAVINSHYSLQSELQERLGKLTQEYVNLNGKLAEAQYTITRSNAVQESQQRELKWLHEELEQRGRPEVERPDYTDPSGKQLQARVEDLEGKFRETHKQLSTAIADGKEKGEQIETLQRELQSELHQQNQLEALNVQVQKELDRVADEFTRYREDNTDQSALLNREVETLKTDLLKNDRALKRADLLHQEISESYHNLMLENQQITAVLDEEKASRVNVEKQLSELRSYELQLQTALDKGRAQNADLKMQLNNTSTANVAPESLSGEVGLVQKKPYADLDQERGIKDLTHLFERSARSRDSR